MWFQQLIREQTGCATYMVGSSDCGECAVFDPLWDIEPYLAAARSKGMNITRVIDSHSHADHVSGARRLVEATGAELFLPERIETTYKATLLADGVSIRFGEVELEVLHVPGHRPEQINLLVRDHSRGAEPWCILTADCLMVGDLARPDLAQDGSAGAATLFRESLPRLLALPDFTEVYPGHVAGST
ncbi:MAG: MBL fold metallo-hydrolase [Acidobacteria bacterium]|uniref:MBL fold metallo-hydrolase n=1 Tax=Candidatus Polarisedimenticola svalbardensis TaxID=2886004 RepID=A0A8J7C2W7_9BACT|nr:MBL fold metallo-hydrolase [Candidatus Polarisedimenticola svalbardensis]